MGKSVRNPKKFIISCRVSDNELLALQTMAQQTGVNISTLLRKSLKLKDQQHLLTLEDRQQPA